jgi:hypothetical protein
MVYVKSLKLFDSEGRELFHKMEPDRRPFYFEPSTTPLILMMTNTGRPVNIYGPDLTKIKGKKDV